MRNKKIYNNLFDSVCMTIFFFLCLVFYLVILWFGVINSKDGTNPIALLIISTILFGVMITITIFLIVKLCYGYWVLLNDSIIYKKLFSRRTKIKLTEIEKIEKKTVSALVLGTYKSEAYIISSGDRKIIILVGGKEYFELDFELAKFINQN